jgi:ABC-type amino acid transport substrate-binding protein
MHRLNLRIFNLLRRAVASLCLGVLALDIFLQWRALHPFDASWQRVRDTGVLRVGMDPTYSPFGRFDGEGQPFGLDVDLANEIAARLGVKAHIVPMGIDGLYSALQTTGVDVVISALSFDPIKLGDVLYSRPYIDAGAILVSPLEGPQYGRMEDLEECTVAVEYGSVGDEVARRWVRRLQSLRVSRYVDPESALKALADGNVDAALVDHVSARLYLRANPLARLRIAAETVFADPYVVATKLSGLELAGKINAVLYEMDADGALAALIARWL